MHASGVFPRTGKDIASSFWSAYERVANQHDNEFLDRHNGDMDVLLIFVSVTIYIFSLHWMEACLDALGWSVLCRQLRFHSEHGIEPDPQSQRQHECTS
jgi:Family of unknown function (DUF6535)